MTMKDAAGKAAYDKSLRPVPKPGQLGDWAAILVLALSACLWAMWPKWTPQRDGTPPLPEPSCAYGVLSPDSTAGKVLTRFSDYGEGLSPAKPDRIHSLIPELQTPPPSPPVAAALPPPEYDGRVAPAGEFIPPVPAFPYATDNAATGLVVIVSKRLQDCGFAFVPPSVTNPAPFSFSATLSFGQEGWPESIIIDDQAGPAETIGAWRAALLDARATNACGTVEVSSH